MLQCSSDGPVASDHQSGTRWESRHRERLEQQVEALRALHPSDGEDAPGGRRRRSDQWTVEVDTVGDHPPTLEARTGPSVVQDDPRARGHHVGRVQGPAHPYADQRDLSKTRWVVHEGLAVRGHHEGGAGEAGEQDGVQAVGPKHCTWENARSEGAVGTPPARAAAGKASRKRTPARSDRAGNGVGRYRTSTPSRPERESLSSVDGRSDDVMAPRTKLASHAADVLLDAAGWGKYDEDTSATRWVRLADLLHHQAKLPAPPDPERTQRHVLQPGQVLVVTTTGERRE
jgi:hypothetical protein